jgi:hypothetical protein
MVKEMKAI